MKKVSAFLLCFFMLAPFFRDGRSCAEPDTFEGRDDISYVLIYNPDIWVKNNADGAGTKRNRFRSTGSLASWIDTDVGIRGGLREMPEIIPFNETAVNGIPEGIELSPEGIRAEGLPPLYKKGDFHDFYIGISNRRAESLECLYAGEKCCVWALEKCISSEQARRYGDTFDKDIYPQDVGTFGTARFTASGGKVHILYYPFEETERSTVGFFSQADLYASGERSEQDIKDYGMNTDHAIININAAFCGNPDFETNIFSTQAHEFQHLICFTDSFESFNNSRGQVKGYPDIWLNEAMSGYIEEKLYPGIQEKSGRYEDLSGSGLIRHGQSLYNFAARITESGLDIGVYGSVFLFSQYLEKKAGPEVFHRIHDYYRSGKNTDMTAAAALYHSMPAEFIREIDGRYPFSGAAQFSTAEQEWMSKLALDFYLSMLHYDESDPDAFEKVAARSLLYDELNPARIEGGGRIIFATRDGSFSIPEDADPGLMFIGLNSGFEPVTGICVK